MELLGRYRNGNYTVTVLDDGTKIRNTKDDEFVSSFPESIDCKITNRCDMNCPYCHENSTDTGKHGDILNAKFIDTLQPYTEIAIGGGNVLEHPDLIEFLQKLKDKNIIANMTVNQKHFIKDISMINTLIEEDLIKGLGTSLTTVTNEFIELISNYPNAVIHVINGIVELEDLKKLANKGLKILILGYKEFRRGIDYYSKEVEIKKQQIHDNIEEINNWFDVVSFDNLAIKQLNLKRLFSDEEWEQFYMGDDGQFTMYVDLVEEQFAKSSISETRYNIKDNIVDMFEVIKGWYK